MTSTPACKSNDYFRKTLFRKTKKRDLWNFSIISIQINAVDCHYSTSSLFRLLHISIGRMRNTGLFLTLLVWGKVVI